MTTSTRDPIYHHGYKLKKCLNSRGQLEMAEVSSQLTAPSCPRARGIEFPRLKYRRQKEEAVAHLQELNVPGVLEELLNKVCRLNPDDLFGYMVSVAAAVQWHLSMSNSTPLWGNVKCGHGYQMLPLKVLLATPLTQMEGSDFYT
jgi:hypothetical protein